VHPTKVIGICLNTYDMDESAKRGEAGRARRRERALPATDPCGLIRQPLVDAIIERQPVRGGDGWVGRSMLRPYINSALI